jgi:chromosome segregation ATPase
LNSAEEEKCSKEIKDELRRLKSECEKLALERNSDVSALLAEKTFVWNQYSIMENDYTNKLRTKQAELDKANEKINALVSSMEQLQSENKEKDSKILQLVSKVTGMEDEAKRLNGEISEPSVELESLRKLKNNQVTPVLNHCTGISRSSKSRNITLKKETCTPDAPAHAKSSEKVWPMLLTNCSSSYIVCFPFYIRKWLIYLLAKHNRYSR